MENPIKDMKIKVHDLLAKFVNITVNEASSRGKINN